MQLMKKTGLFFFIFTAVFLINYHFSLANEPEESGYGKHHKARHRPIYRAVQSTPETTPAEDQNTWYGHSADWRVQVGASFGLVDGVSTGFGFSFQYWHRLESDLPWFFAAESGYDRYSTDPLTTWAVPILFGSRYEFTLSNSKLHPYVGFSFGPTIVHISGTTPGGVTVSTSSVWMEWLVTPIAVRSNQFFVESRLGAAADSQVFALAAGIFL